MAGRVNHRGWTVIESIASTDGSLCVDFFEDGDGNFGFEHFRSDPEDQGRWTPIGTLAGSRFASLHDAGLAAGYAVRWLSSERRPQQAWKTFLSAQELGEAGGSDVAARDRHDGGAISGGDDPVHDGGQS